MSQDLYREKFKKTLISLKLFFVQILAHLIWAQTILGKEIHTGVCRIHLYLQFVLLLVQLYSKGHILQNEMLFSWQNMLISRERLMSTPYMFDKIHLANCL